MIGDGTWFTIPINATHVQICLKEFNKPQIFFPSQFFLLSLSEEFQWKGVWPHHRALLGQALIHGSLWRQPLAPLPHSSLFGAYPVYHIYTSDNMSYWQHVTVTAHHRDIIWQQQQHVVTTRPHSDNKSSSDMNTQSYLIFPFFKTYKNL